MKYCSTKNKQAIKITSNSTKSDNTTILAIKNYTYQQKLREFYDSRKKLDKLLNLVSFHKRILQKISDLNDTNLEDLPNFPINNNNFEDYWNLQVTRQ